MGLRPSARNEDGGSERAPTSPNNGRGSNDGEGGDDESSCLCEQGQGPSSHSPPSPSFASPPSPPNQREAWTARGQLLLNFHHAISRAINSPEMASKCNRIAVDMSRADDDDEAEKASNDDVRRLSNGAGAGAASGGRKSMAEEYGAEAALIVENKSRRDAMVRNKSLALGLFSFVALRGGRGLSSWLRRSIASRASYQFENMTPRGLELRNQRKPVSRGRKLFWTAFDVTISTSATLLSGTFLFMPRPSAYIEDMSKLPLVEGKSVYAEMVCPPLLREYRRVMEQYGGRWPVQGAASEVSSSNSDSNEREAGTAPPQLTQEDVSLNVIRAFVENCCKRSKYERALLEERNVLSRSLDGEGASGAVSRLMRRITRSNGEAGGLAAEANENTLGTVSIPSPGVPESVSVDVDLDVFTLAGDEEEEEESVPKALG